jgi:hypothetical protein
MTECRAISSLSHTRIANLMILMARYCPATRLRSTTPDVWQKNFGKIGQPGEPDMTMIVKNVDGVVIYSAPFHRTLCKRTAPIRIIDRGTD